MNRVRIAVAAVFLLSLTTTLTVGADRPARATDAVREPAVEHLAPGVDYQLFTLRTGHGPSRVHLVTVDLRHAGVGAGLLHAGTVTDRASVSAMAEKQGAVAAINGDFFNMTEGEHPGVAATGSASGAAVLHGQPLKGAVPRGQRFGWKMPADASGEDVLGVGPDGRARTGRLTLNGQLRTAQRSLVLGGLNQYALPEGSIGVFTPDWGSVSRARAACGTDRQRSAPCTRDTFEVTVRDGRVATSATTPGSGPIPAGSLVLLGREQGAQALRALTPGTPVSVDYRLGSTGDAPFDFALGAYPLLKDQVPLPGLDEVTAEPRTAAALADDGHLLRLVATDGREGTATGLTVAELARFLASLKCDEGLFLDGGASTTLVTRDPATDRLTVRNTLDHGQQRRVPNGIAVYHR
ncbi:phosphodiester glycosidase family protein [Streptomyces sp. NPDC006530]|uniref:phosphodiester glycosidase family protein n=1 Tax=Streptomyces sp. NPDC006530 TaxID=3364750 RepID=UPI0036A54E54